MRILVLGGTIFLGRHIVEAALARRHEITLFHRGRHGLELFPAVSRILGDRTESLDALRNLRWDVIVDTSGYVPRVVDLSAEGLRDCADLYVFISSVSVYADQATPGAVEDWALAQLGDASDEVVTEDNYGALKALCEDRVASRWPDRCLLIRPGLIVGPDDPTDRFTYWPVRYAEGGEVLAPGEPERPVQFIDVRDLAEWLVRCCEDRTTGVYNAVGPAHGVSFGDLVSACQQCSNARTATTWVSERFLHENDVEPWRDLPLWLPLDSEFAGLDGVDGTKAWQAGLTTRSVTATVGDTMAWAVGGRRGSARPVGMSREREAELLRRWHDQRHSEVR